MLAEAYEQFNCEWLCWLYGEIAVYTGEPLRQRYSTIWERDTDYADVFEQSEARLR